VPECVLRMTTLREESVCGSTKPQSFYVFAEKTFAVGSFESFLQNKLLRLTI